MVTLAGVGPVQQSGSASESTSISDPYAAILERVRAGDPEALDDLMIRAQAIARRYSLAVCGAAPDTDDAMQEALLKTFQHARRIREPQAFRAWLYRTVKNACLVGRRRRAGEEMETPLDSAREEPPDAAPTADAELESAEARASIRAALGRLRPTYREAVFLRDLEGLSTREVARVLGISEANVKVRLHRAHAQLRRALE